MKIEKRKESKSKSKNPIFLVQALAFALALLICLGARPARAQYTVLGRTPVDTVLLSFLAQQSNAATIIQGLNLYAGTNQFSPSLVHGGGGTVSYGGTNLFTGTTNIGTNTYPLLSVIPIFQTPLSAPSFVIPNDSISLSDVSGNAAFADPTSVIFTFGDLPGHTNGHIQAADFSGAVVTNRSVAGSGVLAADVNGRMIPATQIPTNIPVNLSNAVPGQLVVVGPGSNAVPTNVLSIASVGQAVPIALTAGGLGTLVANNTTNPLSAWVSTSLWQTWFTNYSDSVVPSNNAQMIIIGPNPVPTKLGWDFANVEIVTPSIRNESNAFNNTVIGAGAFSANISGHDNTIVGAGAAQRDTNLVESMVEGSGSYLFGENGYQLILHGIDVMYEANGSNSLFMGEDVGNNGNYFMMDVLGQGNYMEGGNSSFSVSLGHFANYQSSNAVGCVDVGYFAASAPSSALFENVSFGREAGLSNQGAFNLNLGTATGKYETASYIGYLDNIDRGSYAASRTNGLMWWQLASAASNQSLTINATTTINGALGVFGNNLSGIFTSNFTLRGGFFQLGFTNSVAGQVLAYADTYNDLVAVNPSGGGSSAFTPTQIDTNANGQVEIKSGAAVTNLLFWGTNTFTNATGSLGLTEHISTTSGALVLTPSLGSTNTLNLDVATNLSSKTGGYPLMLRSNGVAILDIDSYGDLNLLQGGLTLYQGSVGLTGYTNSPAAVILNFLYADASNNYGYAGSFSPTGSSMTSGQWNLAIGVSNLYKNTTGTSNVAVGGETLFNNTTGSENTVVGQAAMFQSSTGGSNTALGYQALYNNTTGYENTAVGAFALRSAQASGQSTAVGYNALENQTTGGGVNVAVGFNALYADTTGNDNVAIGQLSLDHVTTGDFNTGVGAYTLYNLVTGNSNLALGCSAGAWATNCLNCTFLGAYAGSNLSIATPNGNWTNDVMVGYNAGGNATGNESSNMWLDSLGVAGDMQMIRIGTPGTHTNTVLSGDVSTSSNFNAGLKLSQGGVQIDSIFESQTAAATLSNNVLAVTQPTNNALTSWAAFIAGNNGPGVPTNSSSTSTPSWSWTQVGSGGGGSQTPWTANENAAGYSLNQLGLLIFSNSVGTNTIGASGNTNLNTGVVTLNQGTNSIESVSNLVTTNLTANGTNTLGTIVQTNSSNTNTISAALTVYQSGNQTPNLPVNAWSIPNVLSNALSPSNIVMKGTFCFDTTTTGGVEIMTNSFHWPSPGAGSNNTVSVIWSESMSARNLGGAANFSIAVTPGYVIITNTPNGAAIRNGPGQGTQQGSGSPTVGVVSGLTGYALYITNGSVTLCGHEFAWEEHSRY